MPPFPTILPHEPRWVADHGIALRDFLSSPVGQQTLRRLIWQAPVVAERTNMDLRRIQSDERAGYERCIRDLLQLADPGAVTAQDRQASAASSAATAGPAVPN